ncbi:MAG: hypothetical protein ACPG6V_00890 [Flavobacteriales bacterium]
MKKVIFSIFLLILGLGLKAQNTEQIENEVETVEPISDSVVVDKPRLLKKIGEVLTPKTLQWQYAGNIGMHSVGAEWNVFKNQINFGMALGYVPDSRSIEPLFIGTFQLKYTSNLKINVTDQIKIKPLNFTLQLSTTYGERFKIYNDIDFYPENYYWWDVRTRYGLAHDLEVLYLFESKFAKGISFYLNSSMWDVEFYSIFGNDNLELDRIPYKRLFTLGIGTKIYLN